MVWGGGGSWGYWEIQEVILERLRGLRSMAKLGGGWNVSILSHVVYNVIEVEDILVFEPM